MSDASKGSAAKLYGGPVSQGHTQYLVGRNENHQPFIKAILLLPMPGFTGPILFERNGIKKGNIALPPYFLLNEPGLEVAAIRIYLLHFPEPECHRG